MSDNEYFSDEEVFSEEEDYPDIEEEDEGDGITEKEIEKEEDKEEDDKEEEKEGKDENQDEVEIEEEDENDQGVLILPEKNEKVKSLKNTKRITMKWMTKYEYARIVGMRAVQISKGSKPNVDISGLKDPIEIAKKEIKEKKVPLIIRRTLPDGRYEDWSVNELILL